MTDTAPAGPVTGGLGDLFATMHPGAPEAPTDVEQLLDDWLEGTLAEIGDQPDDQEQVDRLVWVLRRLNERRADVAFTARRRAQLLATWAEEETAKIDRRAEELRKVLEGWAHDERERTGRQTVKLPAGTLKLTARRQSVEIVEPKSDETIGAVGALVPDAVVTKLEVQATPLKDAGLQPGEPIEGYEHPEGYVAHTAVIPGDDTDGHGGFMTVPRVVVLVPAPGREGFSFKVDAR